MKREVRYRWKWGSCSKVSAQAAGHYIREMAGSRKGRVTPVQLVNAAKSKKCPLHNYFEWDNSEAARLYRIEQAKHLLRNLTVEYIETPQGKPHREVKMRVFYSDPNATHEYVDHYDVMTDPELRESIIAEAKEDLVEIRQKLQTLQDPQAQKMVKAINAALAA